MVLSGLLLLKPPALKSCSQNVSTLKKKKRQVLLFFFYNFFFNCKEKSQKRFKDRGGLNKKRHACVRIRLGSIVRDSVLFAVTLDRSECLSRYPILVLGREARKIFIEIAGCMDRYMQHV